MIAITNILHRGVYADKHLADIIQRIFKFCVIQRAVVILVMPAYTCACMSACARICTQRARVHMQARTHANLATPGHDHAASTPGTRAPFAHIPCTPCTNNYTYTRGACHACKHVLGEDVANIAGADMRCDGGGHPGLLAIMQCLVYLLEKLLKIRLLGRQAEAGKKQRSTSSRGTRRFRLEFCTTRAGRLIQAIKERYKFVVVIESRKKLPMKPTDCGEPQKTSF